MVSSIPIQYKWFSNKSIWSIEETLTGTTTPSGSGSNSNKGVSSPPPQSQNWCFTTELQFNAISKTPSFVESYPSAEDTVGIYYAWWSEDVKNIERNMRCSFIPYQIQSLRGVSTNGKLNGIIVLNGKGIILKKISISFIVHSCFIKYSLKLQHILYIQKSNHYNFIRLKNITGINTLLTYITKLVDWFDLVLWYINYFKLFNAISSLCTFIKYVWFVNTFYW